MIKIDALVDLNKQLGDTEAESVLADLAEDLYRDGFSIRENALPEAIAQSMLDAVLAIPHAGFDAAGIGRSDKYVLKESVRSDRIHWISGANETEAAWLAWAERLKAQINQRLFLGLFSFESHFAHYAAGDFYKRHCDAFKGQANRMLSLVVYLNRDWDANNGGELVLYKTAEDQEGIRVRPGFGTVVAFLSEEFPHEVLPATCDRYSIAGWFRINTSNSARIDPPI